MVNFSIHLNWRVFVMQMVKATGQFGRSIHVFKFIILFILTVNISVHTTATFECIKTLYSGIKVGAYSGLPYF